MRPSDPSSGHLYTFSYRAELDQQPTLAIVEAMAWVTDTDPLDLPPLHDSIDIDQLSRIVDPTDSEVFYRSSSGSDTTDPSVSFEYEGHSVTVTPDEIRIREE